MEEKIKKSLIDNALELFDTTITESQIQFQQTRKDVEGDLTLVVFPFVKLLKCSPIEAGNKIGNFIKNEFPEIEKFIVVNGFLNLVFSNKFWLDCLEEIKSSENFGFAPGNSKPTMMVEYSSPNTNKPLHLGHIRNNVLGYAVANILEAAGNKVIKTQIVNDRGIHICKSMVAWLKYGEGETPKSTGLKGDHLVGKYYVIFDKVYKEQQAKLKNDGLSDEIAAKQAPIFIEAQEMLRKWEAQDSDTLKLWNKMNRWVYEGFSETYARLGVHFDKHYYERDT
jgi:arginyl-tRNA synthetase